MRASEKKIVAFLYSTDRTTRVENLARCGEWDGGCERWGGESVVVVGGDEAISTEALTLSVCFGVWTFAPVWIGLCSASL